MNRDPRVTNSTIFTLIFLICPELLAQNNLSNSSARCAALNAINNKVERRFINKQLEAQTAEIKTFDSSPLIFGALQRQKADMSAHINGYNIKTEGIGYLFDHNFQSSLDLLQMGLGATYADSHAKINSINTVNIDNGQILGYANLVKRGFFLSLFLSESESFNKSKRSVPNTSLEALARFRSSQFFTKIRFGRMARVRQWQFTPEASLQYVNVHQRAYNESGAGSANLSVSSSNATGIRAGMGARILAIEKNLSTEVRVFYFKDFKNPLLHPTLLSLSSGALVTPSLQNNKKNSLNIGTALTYSLKPDILIIGNYDFFIKEKGYTENDVSLSICWRF